MCIDCEFGDALAKFFCILVMLGFTLWVGYILVALPCYECRGDSTTRCYKFNSTNNAALRTCFRKSCVISCNRKNSRWHIIRTCMDIEDALQCREQAKSAGNSEKKCLVCDQTLCNGMPNACSQMNVNG